MLLQEPPQESLRMGCSYPPPCVAFLAFGQKKIEKNFFARKNAFFLPRLKAKLRFFLPREARIYFCKKHGCASRKPEKMCFFFFHERHDFAFARGTDLPLGNKKIHAFFFSFRKRHRFASVGGSTVPLRNRKNAFLSAARGTIFLAQEAQPCS